MSNPTLTPMPTVLPSGLALCSPPSQALAPSGQVADSPGGIGGGGVFVALYAIMAVSVAASAIHGYRRNDGSIASALVWATAGFLFPIVTPAIAIAEGFGQPEWASWEAKQQALAQQNYEWKQEGMKKQEWAK